MTKPTSRRKRLLIFLLFIVLFLILIPILVLYSTGYRLSKDLTLQPTGGMYVYYPESGVNITLKGMAPQRTSIFAKSVLIQNLKPGEYELDVSKEGHSYWKKNILVLEKRVSEAYPFLILEPVATSTVSSALRPTIEDLFSATTTATTTVKSNFSLVRDQNLLTGTTSMVATSTLGIDEGIIWKNVFLYKEKNKDSDQLMALWKGETNATPFYFCEEETRLCDTTLVATVSKSPIKHFDFYPGRNDVIIYSNTDGVFVTELDKRSDQNFVTLAKGNVDFRLYNGHIYIKGKSGTYELIYE